MCGIAGFTGRAEPRVLENMTSSLHHRGPDGSGFWQNDRVALGMRRLAIVDLDSGGQPAFNEEKNLVTVMNGEIFNHLELRADLKKKGHKFRSHHSDTEVIPHLYEEYGLDFLQHLNGMFAIALWDEKTETLLLARDRCGIKPLYYSVQKNNVLFGSEIKALLQHPSLEKKPNLSWLSHFLTFKNVPAPQTAFEGVLNLAPGEMLLVRRGEVKKQRWWNFKFAERTDMDFPTAAKELRSLLEKSVSLEMQSDVPVGAYLSGGLDSSGVVAMMASLSRSQVKTFTLVYKEGFRGKSADQEFAKMVSQQYGTEHFEFAMDESDVVRSLDALMTAFDEPFSGTVSTYFLSHLIAQHVKVALSGDGADELFGSYLPHRLATPLYNLQKYAGQMPAQPSVEEFGEWSRDPKKLEAIYNLGDEAARRMAQYVWQDNEKKSLLNPVIPAPEPSAEQMIRSLYADAKTKDALNRALYVDFQSMLPDQILPFVDRLSMAHSLEVRPPFLDNRIVDFARHLPGEYKIHGTQVKCVLREAMRGLLPDSLINRPKEGFVMPVDEWIASKMQNYVREVLNERDLNQHQLFNTPEILKMINDHFSGERQRPRHIWALLCFQVWWNLYFGKGYSS